MTAEKTFAAAESLLERRQLADALVSFHLAEQQGADPDRCAAGRWTAFALQGDLPSAWRESAAIRRRCAPDPNRLWNGEDPGGKRVLVRCLHGFGDSVQLLRLAPRLRASRLIVECAPRAADLLRCLPGIDQVIPWGPQAPDPPAWDVQFELMETLEYLHPTLADLPAATGYLHLPAAELHRAANALGSATLPRIGVVWSSGDWNPSRSLPLDLLAPVLSRTGCIFWNLQGGPVRAQWQTLPPGPHLRDTPLLADAGLLPLAAVIAHLDLVLTVDTLAVHLAGALGIPCLLLLQHAADWRWMVGRDDSPWYPSLRLLRQPEPGDWPGLISLLDRHLDRTLSDRLANAPTREREEAVA